MANKVLLKKSSTVAKVPTTGDLDYGELALNYADGKLYFKNSSNTVQPLGISYTKVIANTTAKINQGYIANTGAGSFTITLPSSPQTGNYVIIVDDASFATNNLYVSGGVEPIVGIYENLTLDIAGVSVTLLYDGGQWNVYTQVGANGGTGAGTEGTIHNYNSFASSLVPSLNNTYKLGNTSYGWTSLYYGDGTIQSTSSNADGSSITNSSGTITAQAGGLAGNTLNSGVVYSNLTTLGTQVQRINWAGSGVAAPQFTSSSVGTKFLLYPAVGASSSDYAIGIDSATIWNSVPLNDVNYFFKWYGGTTNIASLTGTGNFTLAGTLAVNNPTISTTSTGTAAVFNTNATTLNIGGAATTVSIGAATGTLTINNANTVITGNLTVNGTTNTINSTTITVDDKNIELGSVASPTNITADGGGITLKGATDKTFNWVSATSAWTSSEHLDLASAKAYYIAGTSVLNATTLGSAVVTSSLTAVGTIGTGVWQGTLVAGQYGGTGVNNSGKTITLGGNLTTSGAFATTLTATATTSVTLPTTGTLATLAGTETFTNKTLTSPTMTTPTLGVASATSVNKVAITAPATGSTLTIADGKTLTTSNTLTFTGTDASSVAFGTGGTVVYTSNKLSVLAATTSAELAGVISDETGTGVLVFSNTPTLVTPVLGVATATSINKLTITAPTTSATLSLADGSTLGTVGAFSTTLTATGATSVTLPTSGTLSTLAGSETLTNKTISTGSTYQGNTVAVAYGGTGTNNGSITGTGALTYTAGGANSNVNLVPTGTGTVDAASKRITSVAEPTNPQDAATKNYVDNVAAGLHVHEAAHCATTNTLAVLSGGTVTYNNGTSGLGATLTLSVGISSIDGHTLTNGDRVLVKNEATTANNGMYVRTSATVLTRANDFDTGLEIHGGDFTFVENGTLYNNTGWVQTEEVVLVGTDAVLWQQFSGTGTFTAGAGLTLTGTDFDVIGTADRITVNPNSVDIASTYAGQTSITTLGTIGTGTWQAGIVGPTYGGTGVNNGTKTITLGGNFTHSGAHTLGLTTTANTSVTLPTTGTLATLLGTETLSNKTITLSSFSGTTVAASGLSTFTNVTDASSLTTAAVILSGGLSVTKAMYVGTNITGAGAATSTLDGFSIDGGTY